MGYNDKNPDISFPNQKIVSVDLEREMKKSYIEYAMSVIVGRALPDVRDGLKPVHRRILYTMYEDGLTADKTFRKSATTVGAVLGSYHPHGDASVYDALVRLAQDFSLRYPLVEGHGNFGSIDGHPAAAYRYTEARMARISAEMLRDIEKDTIDYGPNFDESKKEPLVIPSRFPNLLVNGSQGIAVGMTTNIPPHNLTEVINAAVCVLENPEAELDDLMEFIKGPDFPTGGIVMGRSGIRSAYATGRGSIRVRSRTEFEDHGGRISIVVTEIPYGVNKARMIEGIANLVKDKRLDGISSINDESDRDGMRIVIGLKRDANPQVVLNRLFSATQLQVNFAAVMLALVQENGRSQPRILSLRQMLDEYIAFQRDVIVRRTRYDLKKAMERAHLLEGLRIACDNIDEVIRTIRESYDDARARLMERFGLSEVQAQAILDMQLKRLQGLERDKIESEYQELEGKIRYYNSLLEDPVLVDGVLRKELEDIRDKYGDKRRTEIAVVEDEIDVEDLIEEQDCVYTLSRAGYIKRTPASEYRTQHKGGVGRKAQHLREEDSVDTVFTASTHDQILFFTDRGKVYRKKGYLIPEAGRNSKGMNIVNIIQVEQGEKVSAMIHVRDFDENRYMLMATRNGTVKRMSFGELKNLRNMGIRALTLEEGDELISVRQTTGEDNIILATHSGMAICFSENDVRPMGRTAVGVRGIRLREDDWCVGAASVSEGGALLSVTELGYGKRTAVEEYLRGAQGQKEAQSRGGYGMRNYLVTEKTGPVAAVKVVSDTDDVLLLSDDGVMIRLSAERINIYGRATQGVRLMKLGEGARVISIARVDHEDEEETAENGGDEA